MNRNKLASINKLIDNKKRTQIEKFVLSQHQSLINNQCKSKQFKLGEKYYSNYRKIFCGFLIGSWYNKY